MAWNYMTELKRKAFHLLILPVIFSYVWLEQATGKKTALLILTGILVIFLLAEYLRLELGFKIPVFGQIIRPKEKEHYYGVIYFLSATVISLSVFDYKIALAALLMTTFGDMIAALVGKRYGKKTIFKNKTFAGTSAELIVNLIVGFFVLSNLYIIIAMAFIATFVETFVEELDDNLLIPLFAGFAGQILVLLL